MITYLAVKKHLNYSASERRDELGTMVELCPEKSVSVKGATIQQVKLCETQEGLAAPSALMGIAGVQLADSLSACLLLDPDSHASCSKHLLD